MLKEIDVFKASVNLLLSRKESKEEYDSSKKELGSAADGRKQEETLGSHYGGCMTILLGFIYIVLGLFLIAGMFDGRQDKIESNSFFNDFQGKYAEAKIS